MLFLLFSIFNCFCQDTSHLSSVTRLNVPLLRHHTLVGTRCWQSRTRVFVVFHYHFHTAAVQRRFEIVEGLVQRDDDSENWFVRWEEEERRCEDDFVVPVPFWNIGLMLSPLNAAGQISDFRRWLVQQPHFWECSQWRGGPNDRRCGSAWEQRGWSRCVGHSSRKEVQALTSLATDNRTLREARAKQHQVQMARGFYSHIPTAQTGDWNGSVSFAEDHIGPHNVQRSEEGQPKRREMRQHMWRTENSLCPCTPKRACSHKKRWRRDGRWLIVVPLDAWALGKNYGLARMNEQLCGSPRLSLDRTRKTWYTFANEERPQSKRVVAFQVNVGGKMGDWKIAYLIATGAPILLSVQSSSKMEAMMDFSTGATFFRNLTDTVFVQLQQEANGTSLCVTGEGYALSINLWRGSVAWNPSSCKSFGNSSQERDRTLRLHTQTEGQVNCWEEN